MSKFTVVIDTSESISPEDLKSFTQEINESVIMSNEWIYGEYKGTVDLIDRGEKGPWALLDAEKLDDDHNTPLVQVGLTEEQFAALNEDDEVTFRLSRADGASEAYLIYNDDTEQPYDIHLSDLRKV
jgi:hypothetical protein